jgi:hypothetical protein
MLPRCLLPGVPHILTQPSLVHVAWLLSLQVGHGAPSRCGSRAQ